MNRIEQLKRIPTISTYNDADLTYLDNARIIMVMGEDRPTRNGIRRTVFGDINMQFDLSQGFPLLTTKKMAFRQICAELVWFMRGRTDLKFLHDRGCHIWDANADEKGDLGPIYGEQWREWYGINGPVDQLQNLIDGLKERPYDTRHMITAWNPADIPNMQLPPCHVMVQFDVDMQGRLNSKMYQRSADWFLGVPFNIASYAMLTMVIARLTGLKPGTFYHTIGNAHIYESHFDVMMEQLGRSGHISPDLVISKGPQTIDDFDVEHFTLMNYMSDPALKADMIV